MTPAGNGIVITTKNKVDTTGYNTLKVQYTTTTDNAWASHISINDNKMDDTDQFVSNFYFPDDESQYEGSLDISTYQGEYYIHFNFWLGGYRMAHDTVITKIWLE